MTSDLARLRAHAKAIEKLPTAATWNFTTRERVVQHAREMLELLDGAVLLSSEQASLMRGMVWSTGRPLGHPLTETAMEWLASPRPEGEQA